MSAYVCVCAVCVYECMCVCACAVCVYECVCVCVCVRCVCMSACMYVCMYASCAPSAKKGKALSVKTGKKTWLLGCKRMHLHILGL